MLFYRSPQWSSSWEFNLQKSDFKTNIKKQHSKLLSLPVSYCRHQDSLPRSCDLSSPTTSGLLESVTLLIGYFYWHQQTIVEGKLIPPASVLHSPTRLPVCLRLRHPNHSMHLRHCALHAGALRLLLINAFLNPFWEAEFLSILYQDSIVQYFKLLIAQLSAPSWHPPPSSCVPTRKHISGDLTFSLRQGRSYSLCGSQELTCLLHFLNKPLLWMKSCNHCQQTTWVSPRLFDMTFLFYWVSGDFTSWTPITLTSQFFHVCLLEKAVCWFPATLLV